MKCAVNKIFTLTFTALLFCFFISSKLVSQVATTCGVALTATVNATCRNGQLNPISAPAASAPCAVASRAVWFRFVPIAGTTTVSVSAPANTGLMLEVFSGTCAGLTSLGCVNNVAGIAAQTESLVVTTNTALPFYYVRVYNTATFNNNVSLCLTSTPSNDEPTGATALTVGTGTCNFTTFGVGNANSTLSSCGTIPAPGCASFSGTSTDVWFSATVPASGNLFIQTENTGVGSPALANGGLAAYSGSACGALTLIGCADSTLNGQNGINNPALYVSGQTPGSTIFIRVWNKNATAKGFFKICVSDLGPCGNLQNNDFCSNPAIMTTSAGSFSSTTTAAGTYSYTSDIPGDVGNVAACSNGFSQNSWYSFVATATSHSFNFNITGCAGGMAVQAFSVATQNGCCKRFTSIASCLGNSVTPNLGATGAQTLTLNSLTIGSQYYIMVESANSPQVCTYTVSGWAATGVLPIDLISFYGESKDGVNYIQWITSAEKNIDSYILESSPDGITFQKVSQVQAVHNSNITQQHYKTYDSHPFKELTYYRLRQLKSGGFSELSHIISVLGPDFYETIHNLYPNPTNSDLNFDFFSKANNFLKIELLGYAGDILYETKHVLEEGNNTFVVPMNTLSKGVYILKVVSEITGKTTHHKIIKN